MWAIHCPSYSTGVTAAKAVSILQGEKGHCVYFWAMEKHIKEVLLCF